MSSPATTTDPYAILRQYGEDNARAADAVYLALWGQLPPVYTDEQRRADERGMAKLRDERPAG
tara:strand:+ start:292 stop:480 length:189 start_codon:yes stop_codon:yes gene_type:complete